MREIRETPVTREKVAFDLKDIGFTTIFPFGSKLDTLGLEGMRVALELDKSADTLAVQYKNLDPTDAEDAKHDTIRRSEGLNARHLQEAGRVLIWKTTRNTRCYSILETVPETGSVVGPEKFRFLTDHELVPADSFAVSIEDQEEQGTEEDRPGHALRRFVHGRQQ